jgi:hypothetical protein
MAGRPGPYAYAPWSSMPGRKKAKENERELFQVKRKKCAQKEFDRADIVRDVRFPDQI